METMKSHIRVTLLAKYTLHSGGI